VLAYRSHEPSLRTLYSAVPTELTIDSKITIMTIAADGKENVDFVYVSYNDTQAVLRVPKDPQARITPGEDLYPETEYTKPYDFTYNVLPHNRSLQTLLGFSHIVFVNRQYQVVIDDQAVEDVFGNSQTLNTSGQVTIWELNPTEWYAGPVLGFSVFCDDCLGGPSGKDTLYVRNPVYHESDETLYESLNQMNGWVQGAYYDTRAKQSFIIDRDQLYVYDARMQVVGAPASLDPALEPNSTKCLLLTPCFKQGGSYDAAPELEYLLATCVADNGTVWTQAFQYDENLATPVKLSLLFQLTEVTHPEQAQCIDGKFLVLENDETIGPNVVIYDFNSTIGQTGHEALLLDTFSAETLQDGPEPLRLTITAFHAVRTPYPDASIVFLVNETNIVFYVEVDPLSYDPVKIYNRNVQDEILVAQDIQDANQFILDRTRLIQISVLAEEYYPKDGDEQTEDSIIYHLLLVTNETAVYEFTWSFVGLLVDGERELIYENGGVQYAYAPYGDGLVLPYVATLDTFFAVAYANSEDLEDAAPVTYTVAVYEYQLTLPESRRQMTITQRREAGVEPLFIKMIGGYDFPDTLRDPHML